jgi:hypothetical protein
MISYGNPNIFFANIGRGDVGIAPYNSSINGNLFILVLPCPVCYTVEKERGFSMLDFLGLKDEALKYFELGVAYDPSLEHRANLDPELFDIVKLRNSKLKCYDEEFY